MKKIEAEHYFVYTLFYVYQKFSGFARPALGIEALALRNKSCVFVDA
jgi:hypothetical protein